jgi:hypothetical protein
MNAAIFRLNATIYPDCTNRLVKSRLGEELELRRVRRGMLTGRQLGVQFCYLSKGMI